MTRWFGVVLLVVGAGSALAQTTPSSLTTKPIFATWKVSDVAGVGVNFNGRTLAEPVGSTRVLRLVPLISWDFLSIITFRVTTLVPAAETWEVQSVAFILTPVVGTGLRLITTEYAAFAKPYVAAGGTTVALDIDPKTGVTVVGPVSMPAPPTGLRLVSGGASPPVPVCLTSSPAWQSTPLNGVKTGTFTVLTTVTPNSAPIDSVVGLAAAAPTAYTGIAAIVAFTPIGVIQARNGGAYSAVNVVTYTAGQVYGFRFVVDTVAHKYTVYVKPPGQAEIVVGQDYAFRTEQATATSLGYLGTYAETGSVTACY